MDGVNRVRPDKKALGRVSLDETELLRGLGEDRLDELRSHLQMRPFPPGEYLYVESQPADYLWLVCVSLMTPPPTPPHTTLALGKLTSLSDCQVRV